MTCHFSQTSFFPCPVFNLSAHPASFLAVYPPPLSPFPALSSTLLSFLCALNHVLLGQPKYFISLVFFLLFSPIKTHFCDGRTFLLLFVFFLFPFPSVKMSTIQRVICVSSCLCLNTIIRCHVH